MKLKDVLEKVRTIDISVHLFGATAEFLADCGARMVKLGEALAKEKGVTKEELNGLPPETEFASSEAQAEFADFCQWFEEVKALQKS